MTSGYVLMTYNPSNRKRGGNLPYGGFFFFAKSHLVVSWMWQLFFLVIIE